MLGRNALHYAACGGSVEAMKYAISLGIAADSRDHFGANALHHAAWGGSVEAVLFIRRLSYEFNLKLESTIDDAYWYADQSENAEEIKKILDLPKEKFLPLEEKKSLDEKKLKKMENREARELRKKICLMM